MNYHTLIKAHEGIIYLFLLIFTIKVLLLIFNKSAFDKVRAKTKITEMILGTLLLVTGIWLLIMRGGIDPVWLQVKIALVLIAIPIAIIGLRKANMAMALIALGIFVYVFLVARSKSLSLAENLTTTTPQITYAVDHQKMITFNHQDCEGIHQSFKKEPKHHTFVLGEKARVQHKFLTENSRLYY